MKTFVEVFGWYGMVAIVLAYVLVSFSVWESSNIWYQVLNLTGALGLGSISFYKRTYQPGVLNIIWAIVATVALANILL